MKGKCGWGQWLLSNGEAAKLVLVGRRWYEGDATKQESGWQSLDLVWYLQSASLRKDLQPVLKEAVLDSSTVEIK